MIFGFILNSILNCMNEGSAQNVDRLKQYLVCNLNEVRIRLEISKLYYLFYRFDKPLFHSIIDHSQTGSKCRPLIV